MRMKGVVRILLFCLLAHPLDAADKWLSIHSKNFLLIGSASEADLRRLGRFLEEYRKSFGLVFPKIDQNASALTTVLVFRNDEAFRPYKPANGTAFFQSGDDVNYIALSASSTSFANALHDYAHVLLRENAASLPLWATEGLAESFSTFEAGKRQNEFTLGLIPSAHSSALKDTPVLPLKTLFEQDQGSTYYNESSKQGVFYAESWGLVHYFMFGPNTQRRSQLGDFIKLASTPGAIEDKFVTAFQTDYPTLQDEFRDYLRHPLPTLKIVSNQDLQIDVRAMMPKSLSDAEVEYYIGDWFLHTNRLPEAEVHLKNAISKDANATPAQASLGLLRARQKNYEEALSLLNRSVDSDPKNYLFNFYYADVLQSMEDEGTASSDSGERRDAIRAHLNKSIDAAPRFVEAYKLLARINVAAGETLAQTENLLKKALSLAPGRDDLRMLLAQSYVRANRTADASALLSDLEHMSPDPTLRRRSRSMLDELAPLRPVFTEILPEKPKESQPATTEVATPPLPPPPPSRREPVLQPLMPIGPAVEGEKMEGLLVLLDCTNGLTLRVQTEKATVDLHSPQPEKIQFLSYTADVSDNIRCGPRSPGIPVAITYKPVAGGTGEPLVVEFVERK